jgi:hypothetical protein
MVSIFCGFPVWPFWSDWLRDQLRLDSIYTPKARNLAPSSVSTGDMRTNRVSFVGTSLLNVCGVLVYEEKRSLKGLRGGHCTSSPLALDPSRQMAIRAHEEITVSYSVSGRFRQTRTVSPTLVMMQPLETKSMSRFRSVHVDEVGKTDASRLRSF